MKLGSQKLPESAKELLQFFKGTNFSKAILVGIAITVPIVLGIWSDYFEIGLALCFGAFWSSPSDISGSYHHKKYGILLSALLAMVVSFIGGYLQFGPVLILPVLGVLVFAISIIAVYGFRASLISFSGLLALVLSFAHTVETLEIYQYALLIGVGGLWYLLLSTVWYRLNPKAQTEEILSTTFLRTAQYLETRGKLLGAQTDRKELQSRLLTLQSDLTDNHKTLREILVQGRVRSGKSNYQGKRLLVFVELIDVLETAMANPVEYDKMDALLEAYPEYIKSFQELISTNYRISRKDAFLETSNLSSAFQRMPQEPRSKQKNLDKIYELVVLNHTFLSSLASLSTYIQQNNTTEASETFRQSARKIADNLERAAQCFGDKKRKTLYHIPEDKSVSTEAINTWQLKYEQRSSAPDTTKRNRQEAHLVTEQMQWLFSLSGKMLRLAGEIAV